MFVPQVIESIGNGMERGCDIISRLLKDRIILLNGEIDGGMAASICSQLIFLEATNAEEPVCLYINSPGGAVTAGMAIYDTMRFITCPVATVAMGVSASMGAFLLCSGTPGMRFSLPHTEIMIHQVLGGCQGQATDIEIHARRMLQTKEMLNSIMANNTGRSYEEIVSKTERDTFLNPEEARTLGLIDYVLTSRREIFQVTGQKAA